MPLGCGLIYKYLIGTHFAQNISICVASGAGKPAPHTASYVLGEARGAGRRGRLQVWGAHKRIITVQLLFPLRITSRRKSWSLSPEGKLQQKDWTQTWSFLLCLGQLALPERLDRAGLAGHIGSTHQALRAPNLDSARDAEMKRPPGFSEQAQLFLHLTDSKDQIIRGGRLRELRDDDEDDKHHCSCPYHVPGTFTNILTLKTPMRWVPLSSLFVFF